MSDETCAHDWTERSQGPGPRVRVARVLVVWRDERVPVSDHDRLMSAATRILEDGCTACNMSKVYCRCVTYIDGPNNRCCGACSH
jgi:hypothetical protein